MHLEKGTKVVITGRCEDFTDHLGVTIATVADVDTDTEGYIRVIDKKGTPWYVQAIDVEGI